MDLATMRKMLEDKATARERVAAERDELRTKTARFSEASRAAEEYSRQKALFCVINPSLEAQATADAAKATVASAFEQETKARDRLALVERALRLLDDEIAGLSQKLPPAENEYVGRILTEQIDEIDSELVAVAAKLFARARARGTAKVFDFGEVVTDRLVGDGSRPGLRQRVLDAAELVRAQILRGEK